MNHEFSFHKSSKKGWQTGEKKWDRQIHIMIHSRAANDSPSLPHNLLTQCQTDRFRAGHTFSFFSLASVLFCRPFFFLFSPQAVLFLHGECISQSRAGPLDVLAYSRQTDPDIQPTQEMIIGFLSIQPFSQKKKKDQPSGRQREGYQSNSSRSGLGMSFLFFFLLFFFS
ncbi:hypothetical protein L873DRAFT_481862 [Choiromyces venosus 120613-1]|uniref:Uncharacterized protein n=1 Tax=Choiromyces venosus 120613-1 TaxID=1336337 RepID=A0A3N4JXU8_9PEZI|nr:hypothetical protein L873DRAFT_481862 [Choiromyces venosus 120613-1]